jgi:DNA-binding MarR family transcriptional regulator
MALPNLWSLYNLRSSPYFQATLRADSQATPLRLFVGRQLLLGWAKEDSASTQTQAQLVDLWQVKQPSVSQTLQQLIEAGAVEALPRRGREAIQYLMSGKARLAL